MVLILIFGGTSESKIKNRVYFLLLLSLSGLSCLCEADVLLGEAAIALIGLLGLVALLGTLDFVCRGVHLPLLFLYSL